MNAVILKPRVGYCDIGDRLVFLDVDRDRYLMIAPELEMAVRELVAGRVVDAKGLEALAATGLFISSHAAAGSSHPFRGSDLPAHCAIELKGLRTSLPSAPITSLRFFVWHSSILWRDTAR